MLKWSLKNSAFSLLELIISVAILSIGITVILQALSFSARITGLSGDIINAVFLAQDQLQELEFKERKNLISSEPKEVNDKKDKFIWNYTLNFDTALNLYKLDFKISWQRMHREETINLNTYLKNLKQ